MKNSQRLAEKNDFSEPVITIKRMSRVAVSATKLNPREHATQDELFPKSWVTEQ